MLPTGPLETAQQVTPPLGFQEVMACLQRDPSLVAAYEAPQNPCGWKQQWSLLWPWCVSAALCRMRPWGWHIWILSPPPWGDCPQGPQPGDSRTYHRGHHWPPLKDSPMTTFGWRGRLMTTFDDCFGQNDCDAIWQKQSHVFCNYSSYMPQWLFMYACWAGKCSLPFCNL